MAPPAAAPELGSCCICLDVITGAARALPCLHAFCLVCIRRWLEGRPTCPLCKAPVQSLIHSVASDECFEEIPVGGGPVGDGAPERDAAVVWGEDYDAGPIDLTAADGEGAGGGAGAEPAAEPAAEAEASAAPGRTRGADAAQDFIERVARGPRLPLLPNTPGHEPGAPYLRRVTEWVEGALVGTFAVTARELATMTDYVMAMLAECGFDDDGLADALEPLLGAEEVPAFVRSLLFVAARCVTVGPSRLAPQRAAPPSGRGVVFLDTSDSDSEGSEEDSWSESEEEESSSGLSTSDLTAIDDTETEESDAEAGGAAGARRPAARQYVSTRGRQTPAVRPVPRSLARRPRGRATAGPAPPRSRGRGEGRDPQPAATSRPTPAEQARACRREQREEGEGAGSGVAAGGAAGWGMGGEGGRGERRAEPLGEAGPPRVQARRMRRTEVDRAPAPVPAPAPISAVDLTAGGSARPAGPAPAGAARAPPGAPGAAPTRAPAAGGAAMPSSARGPAAPATTVAAASTAAAVPAPVPAPAGLTPAADPRRAGARAPARAARAEAGRIGGRGRRPAAAAAREDPDPGSSARKRRRTEMEVAAWVRENLLGAPRRNSAAPAPQPGSRPGPSLAELLGRYGGGSGRQR
ncbi:ubiquitin E3 ligase ICP0 [Cervid alphaherpesvirus 1]|uniref:E3 ubiquitin-protein ligase ICP0 n=1 Tax=Cervid alphaherpesvirus 1 TaxID=79891 RepID=A0A455JIV9_9ALPH|nr:ubiquitin E3 ligase ICP0 [Cervid alphaherpesvirus 1]AVT50711.1 ubiquitin E3 ligase ICP0 [Cervid alphaherpesvirus 1]